MIKQDFSLFQNAMNLGAMAGIAMSLIQIALFSFGAASSSFDFLLILVLIIAISWGTRKYRDVAQEGFISYGQSLWFGTATSIGAGFVYAFFFYIWMKFIDTEYINALFDQMEIAMYESEIYDDEKIEMFMSLYRSILGPGMLAFGMLFNYTLFGFLGSLIISIFAKREKPMFG